MTQSCQMFSVRLQRLVTLVEIGAGRAAILMEAKMVLMAGSNVTNEWQLAWKIFLGCFAAAFNDKRLRVRVWWLQKKHGMSWDEALEQYCKEREPKQ